EKNKKGITISFEYTHNVKRANDRIVERTEYVDLLYHTEDGRPILSEKGFEHDGRGFIIMGEYLRQDKDFVDGFEYKLKKKLNSTEPVPMSR
ncbi:hypothetical protein IJT10_03505, partial [bacterium]|nr:hypothetical protein [bacterium]